MKREQLLLVLTLLFLVLTFLTLLFLLLLAIIHKLIFSFRFSTL